MADHWIQHLVNGMNAEQQEKRAASEQMTLGKLIAVLESLPSDTPVEGLGALDSYRGYYSDLAFEDDVSPRTVGDVLADCRNALGERFTGYKGGDYYMTKNTPLWVSDYGCASGKRLMGLSGDAPAKPITSIED